MRARGGSRAQVALLSCWFFGACLYSKRAPRDIFAGVLKTPRNIKRVLPTKLLIDCPGSRGALKHILSGSHSAPVFVRGCVWARGALSSQKTAVPAPGRRGEGGRHGVLQRPDPPARCAPCLGRRAHTPQPQSVCAQGPPSSNRTKTGCATAECGALARCCPQARATRAR